MVARKCLLLTDTVMTPSCGECLISHVMAVLFGGAVSLPKTVTDSDCLETFKNVCLFSCDWDLKGVP